MEFIDDLINALSGGGGGGVLDSDLIAIANLTATNDDVMQFKSGAWANRTLTQLATDLTAFPGDFPVHTPLLQAWNENLANIAGFGFPSNAKILYYPGGGGSLAIANMGVFGGKGLIAFGGAGATTANTFPYFLDTGGSTAAATFNAATRSLLAMVPAAGTVPFFNTTSTAAGVASTAYGRSILNLADSVAAQAFFNLNSVPNVITTSTTLLSTDSSLVHVAPGVTVTLPTSPTNGQKFTFFDYQNGWAASPPIIRISGGSGQTIDGTTQIVPAVNKQAITVQLGGTNWEIVGIAKASGAALVSSSGSGPLTVLSADPGDSSTSPVRITQAGLTQSNIFKTKLLIDRFSGNRDGVKYPIGTAMVHADEYGNLLAGHSAFRYTTTRRSTNISVKGVDDGPGSFYYSELANYTNLGAGMSVEDSDDPPDLIVGRWPGPKTKCTEGSPVTIGYNAIDVAVEGIGTDITKTAWPDISNGGVASTTYPYSAYAGLVSVQNTSGLEEDEEGHLTIPNGANLGRILYKNLQFTPTPKLIGVVGAFSTVKTAVTLDSTPRTIEINEVGSPRPKSPGTLFKDGVATPIISYTSLSGGQNMGPTKFNNCTVASGTLTLNVGDKIYQRVVLSNGDALNLITKPYPRTGAAYSGVRSGEAQGRIYWRGPVHPVGGQVGGDKYDKVSNGVVTIGAQSTGDWFTGNTPGQLTISTTPPNSGKALDRVKILDYGLLQAISGISFGVPRDLAPANSANRSVLTFGQFSNLNVNQFTSFVDTGSGTITHATTTAGDATHNETQTIALSGFVTDDLFRLSWTNPDGYTGVTDQLTYGISGTDLRRALEDTDYVDGTGATQNLFAAGDLNVTKSGDTYTVTFGLYPTSSGSRFKLTDTTQVVTILNPSIDGHTIFIRSTINGASIKHTASGGTYHIKTGSAADVTLNSGQVMQLIFDSASATWNEVGNVAAAAAGTYQPLDSDLTAIAALTTDAFGRGLLPLTTAAAVRTYIGAGTSSVTLPIAESDVTNLTTDLAAKASTTHATAHKSGGSDSIKLDELAAPTDITTLNASTTAHGLLQKLDNNSAHYMDGTGAWSTPPGAGGIPAPGSPVANDFLQYKGSAWTNRTPTQVLADLAAVGTTFQPLDSDLTTIAGLTATTDNVMQSKAGAWSSRTMAQLATDLLATNSFQPKDTDLTAVAALTTDSFGLQLLTKTTAAAVRTYIGAGTATPVFVTPEDFGALGDGTTDDSTAITNWLASDNPKRAPFDADAKNYLVAGTFTIAQSDDIDFGGSTLSCKNSSTTKILVTANNVTLRNLIFDGRRTGTSVVSRGIEWQGNNGKMIDCEVSNHNDSDAAILVNATGAELTCTRCAAHNNGARATGDSGSVLRVPTAETVSISYGMDGFAAILGRLETYDCKANYNSRCGLYTSATADENCVVDLIQCKGNFSALIRTTGSPTSKRDESYQGSAAAVCLRSNRGVIKRVIMDGRDASNADASRYGIHIGAFGGGSVSESGENWKVDLISAENFQWANPPTSAAEVCHLRGGHNTHIKNIYANNCYGYALAFGGGANNTGSGDNAIPTGHRVDQVHARQIANPSVSVTVGRNISIGHVYMYGSAAVDIGEGTASVVDTVSIDKISAFGCTTGVFVNTGSGGTMNSIHVGTIEAHDCTSTAAGWPNALVWLIGKTNIDRIYAETKAGGTKPDYIVKSEDLSTPYVVSGQTHFIELFEPISYNTAPTLIANTSNIVIRLQPYAASKALTSNASGYISESTATTTELQGLHSLTASRALATDGSGILTPATTTATELGYVSGVTSAIQTQLNAITANPSNVLVLKTADETVNNSSTPQDDNELLFAVTANKTYFIEMNLLVSAPSANSDLKIVWSGPSGTTANWGETGTGNAGTWGTPAAAASPAVIRVIGANPIIGSVNGTFAINLKGWLFVSSTTTGGFKLTWSQGTATAEDTKILAGSFLRYQKLN